MPQIEVMLEVPLEIAKGLATGQLERVGGVVRDVASKQVVAWLREGGKIADNVDLASGILKTVLQASTGGWVSTGASMVNVAVTARSHFLIMQELQGLTNLVGVVGGIGILNLATTIISTGIILKRMNDLEQTIRELDVGIAKQFAQNRQVKMEGAIHAADNARDMEGAGNREFAARIAIDKLFEARQHVWREIDTLRGSSRDVTNNALMQKNVEQAMHLDSLYCRCLLELDNLKRAKSYLNNGLGNYMEISRCLVHRHLGTHRAAFFHHTIDDSDMLRYIAIEHWLRDDESRLLDIIRANRREFWSKDVADEKKLQRPGMDRYIEALTQSELLIENLKRFHGVYAEIEAIERLGISFREWQSQQDEAIAKKLAEHDQVLENFDDYVLLVVEEQSENEAAA